MTIFTQTLVPSHGVRTRGFVVTCGHCGVVGSVPANTFKSPSDAREERFVARKLENVGWKIGNKESQHRCPGCYSAIKASAKRKSEDRMPIGDDPKVAAVLAKFPTKVPAATEMTREDRRIIFEKMNEVYQDEKSGYAPGWTDAKVASDLGIARAWVSKVREEMFGPEGSNEDIRKAVQEAKATLAECRKLAETFTPLLGRADKIEKTLVEIERALR